MKVNRGETGIGGQSIEQLEKDLLGNVYKLWNRMTSGLYFPFAAREMKIQKKSGEFRILGIPRVSDQVAQQVAETKIVYCGNENHRNSHKNVSFDFLC